MADSPQGIAFIPSQLDERNLSPAEFRIYCHVVRRAGRDSTCWESIQNMAKKCRLCPNTVRKALHFLVDDGMIAVKPHPGYTYDYTVCDIAHWKPRNPL